MEALMSVDVWLKELVVGITPDVIIIIIIVVGVGRIGFCSSRLVMSGSRMWW